ncbi:MAG: hypothetical protein AAF723_00745, partial [Pseudomonadota bacterium]
MRFLKYLFVFIFLFITQANAAVLIPGNILATQNNQLREYDRNGVLVSTLDIPHPDTMRYRATDVVVDENGLIHVLNTSIFSNSYLSTYNLRNNSWQHTEVDLFLGDISTGDLSISGNKIYTKSQIINLNDYSVVDIDTSNFEFPRIEEIVVGGDGNLHAIDNTTSISGIRTFNLDDNGFPIGSVERVELSDENGSNIDARGLVVLSEQRSFVADWNGNIYEYNGQNDLLNVIDSGTSRFNNLDFDMSETLLGSTAFGDIFLYNIMSGENSIFKIGNSQAYSAFVPNTPIPLPPAFFLFLTSLLGLTLCK